MTQILEFYIGLEKSCNSMFKPHLVSMCLFLCVEILFSSFMSMTPNLTVLRILGKFRLLEFPTKKALELWGLEDIFLMNFIVMLNIQKQK